MPANQVIIVGGGAAGMLAALFSVREGTQVTLLERNEKLGKKIYITGKGRCNLTNAAEGEDFMRGILRNPRFMYAAFATLDNRDMMSVMEALGVPLKTERGNRVFPQSDRASDVTAALERELRRLRVQIRLGARVESLVCEADRVSGVRLECGDVLRADAVVLATGGLSYPTTGSTGDGYALAESVGHSIAAPCPALTSIETRESWPGMLTGLSLKNVTLKAYRTNGKKEKCFYDELGEMLFTHYGVSGPLVLTLSSLMPEALEDVRMSIDLKPGLDEQKLEARLLRDFQEMSRKRLSAVTDGLMPHNLGLQLLVLAGISPETPVNAVTQEQRRTLIRLIKGIPLRPKALRGFNEAIITRGGVSVREINPSTMASKRMKGLYFAGEMIDVDAQTGGFNLQIAFSTGALAGKSAAMCGEAQL